MTFEEAQRELERIVQQLESGQADLDEAITLWERGEELYRLCSDKLDSAQGKIEGRRLIGPAPVVAGSLHRGRRARKQVELAEQGAGLTER